MTNRTVSARRKVTSQYKYLGNYPSNKSTDWTDKIQGVTHNRDHWIFTQHTKIHKFHASLDLAKAGRRNAADVVTMPKELEDRGCNHFGDPDYIMVGKTGYLFVPVEGTDRAGPVRMPDFDCGRSPKVAVFADDGSAGRFRYVGFSLLPRQLEGSGSNKAGWLAISPRNFFLHSSYNRINDGYPIYRYRINFRALGQNQVRLTEVRNSLVPRGRRDRVLHIGTYIQGGCFAPDGRLFILAGDPGIGATTVNRGIFVLDAAGKLLDYSRTSNADFLFQFDPSTPNFQEPEGITYWNTANIPGVHGKLKGELHPFVLNPKTGRNDAVWFKHYSTPNPPTSGDGVPVFSVRTRAPSLIPDGPARVTTR